MFCGVTGIKPTYGRVSRYGMVAFASSLDQGGPFARSAEDCALLLQTMAKFDPLDSTSSEQPVPDYSARLGRGIDGLKIGLPREYFAEGLDSRLAGVIETAIDELRKLGAEIKEISLAPRHPTTKSGPTRALVGSPRDPVEVWLARWAAWEEILRPDVAGGRRPTHRK